MGLGNNPLATQGDRVIKNTLDSPRAAQKPGPAATTGYTRKEPDQALQEDPSEERQGRVVRQKTGKRVKSFSLDDHLAQRLRAFAFHEEEKASAVVSKALHQYLSERGY